VLILANGFIVTSLLWGTMLAHLIDGRVRAGAMVMLLAAGFAWFGIIHSPLPSSPILNPSEVIVRLRREGRYAAAARQTPYHWAAAYVGVAATILTVGLIATPSIPERYDLPDAM
jgi:AGZA family xanthine/uracil permease-like MFS transporter